MTTAEEGDLPLSGDVDNTSYDFVHDFSDQRPSRFRFKSRRRCEDETDSSQAKRRKHDSSRRHHHRHHHRHRKEGDESEGNDKPEDPTEHMDPETAFRQSLFDAMADDEGAAYWEGVYGQPMHIYPNTKPAGPTNPEGTLEQMSDEEYAAYVRGRMWEKSHQHILEERRAREEAAKKRSETRKRTARTETEKEEFDRQMEESLRKGAERRREKGWRDAWAIYTRSWDDLVAHSKGRTGDEDVDSVEELMKRVPWPVRSGKRSDVDREHVDNFYHHATAREGSEAGLRAVLKTERVRWHPDRMSHLLKGRIDANTLQSVTAVFQIVDDLWAKANGF